MYANGLDELALAPPLLSAPEGFAVCASVCAFRLLGEEKTFVTCTAWTLRASCACPVGCP